MNRGSFARDLAAAIAGRTPAAVAPLNVQSLIPVVLNGWLASLFRRIP